MLKKLMSFLIVCAFLTSSLSPATAAMNENKSTNLESEYKIEDVVELKDGSKLKYNVEKKKQNTIITAEINKEKSVLTVNSDNTMTLTEIHPDGTIKNYDNEDIKEFFVVKEGKVNPSEEEVIINNSSDEPLFQSYAATASAPIIDLGDKNSASGKRKITYEGYAEFLPYSLLTSAVATFVVNLMISHLTTDAKSGNKLTTNLLTAAAAGFLSSLTITTGKVYLILYQYKDTDPIVNGNYYRTQLLFFSDANYNDRLGTISYYWGVFLK